MQFRFALDRPLADEYGRLWQAGVEDVRVKLSGTGNVHGARKTLKRLRALLDLTAMGLDRKVLAKKRNEIREVKHRLAGLRDSQAAVEAATFMAGRSAEAEEARIFAELAETLRAKLATGQDGSHAPAGDATLAKLSQPIQPQLKPKALLAASVKGYARAHAAMLDAIDSDTDDAWHDWRKHVQRHWRQTQMLSQLWPEEAQARAKLAASLSETLGLHHDLCLLRDAIHEAAPAFADARDVRRAQSAAERERGSLIKKAVRDGRRLFAEAPDDFHRRMKIYWQTATDKEPAARKAGRDEAKLALVA